MSEEAIRAMEDIELAHVKTRIQCLRNLRTLLDVSVVQMEQYMNVVSVQSNTNNGAHVLRDTTTTSQSPLIDENNPDFIRRRRLEHLATRITSSASTDTQDDKNNNDA